MAQDKRHPKTTYQGEFPYNRVHITESGHEIHFDDTPGKERIRISHKSGTYTEVSPDGKQVDMVVGSKFDYVKQGYTQTIDKNSDVKIGGASRTNVTGSVHTEIKGDSSTAVNGSTSSLVGGDAVSAVKGDSVTGITGKSIYKIGGGIEIKGDKNVVSKIDAGAKLEFGNDLDISSKKRITFTSDVEIVLQVGSNKIVIAPDHISVITKSGKMYLFSENDPINIKSPVNKVDPPWVLGAEKPPEA